MINAVCEKEVSMINAWCRIALQALFNHKALVVRRYRMRRGSPKAPIVKVKQLDFETCPVHQTFLLLLHIDNPYELVVGLDGQALVIDLIEVAENAENLGVLLSNFEGLSLKRQNLIGSNLVFAPHL